MFSEDYILRMVRQATAVLASIIGLKSTGQYQEALQDIDQALEQLLGMDPKLIRLLDDVSLYKILTKNDVLDLEKLGLLADLFKEEGDIKKLQNQNNESVNCYIRSLNYYLMISINSEASRSIELSQKIDELLQKLEPYNFEEKTLLNLFYHYENTGEFAKADNMLSGLAARNNSDANAMDEMRSFYKRLMEKSLEELVSGGMSRAQIRNKLKELE
jgi:tetratricopeptide (TPR) repeat protein